MEGTTVTISIVTGSDPHGMRRLLLPADLQAWTVLPERAELRWTTSPWVPPVLASLRVYPAASREGCPASAPALLDSVVASASWVPLKFSGRLSPGKQYRVELGSGAGQEAGCLRVASEQERDAVQAALRALREEYAPDAAEGDEVTLPLLEAALLAGQGFPSEALLRLEPLLARADAPPLAVQLWGAIIVRHKLRTPGH